MATRRTIGRRYSQRVAEVHAAEHGETWLVALDERDRFGTRAIAKRKDAALAMLEDAGIPAARILAEQGEAVLRDYVLNSKDHEPDSLLGLAARVVELCERVERLPGLGAPGAMVAADAALLGKLTALAEIYEADRPQRKKAAKAPRPNRRDPLRARLVDALRLHRREGRTLKEALRAMRDAPHGLRVRETTTGYTVTDESAPSGAETRAFARGTLDTLWTEAGKPKAKRR